MAELADAYALGAYGVTLESSTLSWPTKNIMKVTIENKKGLNKDLKVFVDKKTIETYLEEKYEEIMNEEGYLDSVLEQGAVRANEVAEKTCADVRDAMGFVHRKSRYM